jgi:hypothetical protein
MNVSKIAGLVLASILAVAPATLAGGLGDIKLPDGHFNMGATGDTLVSTHSRSVINFYTSTETSHTKGSYIAPCWWGYPLGFAAVNK